jgi:hypothetical protein
MIPLKLAAIAMFCFALPLHAQAVDPLWTKALAHAALVKKWAPEDMAMHVDATGEGKHERVKSKSHLKGWENGKPVYDTVQTEPKEDSGKLNVKGSNDMGDASKMADGLMRPDAPVRRTDGQMLHGKSWTIFDVSESKGPVDVSVRMWVDPLTGIAHQVESKFHGTLMFDMQLTTNYAPHKQVGSLPERTDFKLKVLVPFVDANVKVATTMDNWIPRPN